MSTSSLNTSVTSESPNLEKLLAFFSPGIAPHACSTGIVISRSISGAPSDGDTVIT